MNVAIVCASHTPLKDYYAPAQAIVDEVEDCLRKVRERVERFSPELVIAIGPDHFNGFFYRCMPSFCIGVEADSVGDWNTPAGPLPGAGDTALACAEALHAASIDAAISYRMDVDHGITQLLNQVFDWQTLPATIPVFVNCAAPPRPPMARVAALGAALGRFAAASGKRVLIAASGGLSHDPPIPTLAEATAPVRERLVAGGALNPEARAARQQRVIDDAEGQVAGTSPRLPPDPAWDERFLADFTALRLDALCAMDDAAISAEGGCGGHEIRTWIAAAAAAEALGLEKIECDYYRTIPEWITGYGVATAM